MTRRSAIQRVVALAAAISAASAWAQAPQVHEGYDAFWQTLPSPVFSESDEKPLDSVQVLEGEAFRAWSTMGMHSGRSAPPQHRVEIVGTQVTLDREPFPVRRASVFPGENPAEPGADSRLFVRGRHVCIQGTAPSSSGTAQRHVHVTLVTDAFTPRARRYDLPSLFASCLALGRDASGGVRFLEGVYSTPPGAQVSDGVDFTAWRLHDGHFVKTDRVLRIRFVDPANVVRFRVLAP